MRNLSAILCQIIIVVRFAYLLEGQRFCRCCVCRCKNNVYNLRVQISPNVSALHAYTPILVHVEIFQLITFLYDYTVHGFCNNNNNNNNNNNKVTELAQTYAETLGPINSQELKFLNISQVEANRNSFSFLAPKMGYLVIFGFFRSKKCHLRWAENVMFATEP